MYLTLPISVSPTNQLFDYLLESYSNAEKEIVLSVQWAHDIVSEFVYQFQGFCQYRCQASVRAGDDEVKLLQEHAEIWNLPTVVKILNALSRFSKFIPDNNKLNANNPNASGTVDNAALPVTTSAIVGYFSVIEFARLNCLLGDYVESLRAVAPLRFRDKYEWFTLIPTSQANILYHAGLCLLMLRRYADAIETFSDVILFISRLLKSNGIQTVRANVQNSLVKILDKVTALAAISISLLPGYRVDDLVKELVDKKWEDKYRRLVGGDLPTFESLFELAAPKFVSPAVPEYGTSVVTVNATQEAYKQQVGDPPTYIDGTTLPLSLDIWRSRVLTLISG